MDQEFAEEQNNLFLEDYSKELLVEPELIDPDSNNNTKKTSKSKIKSHTLIVSVDSEFTDDKYISLQACVTGFIRGVEIGFKFILINNEFKDELIKNYDLEEKIFLNIYIFYTDIHRFDYDFLSYYILFILNLKYKMVFDSEKDSFFVMLLIYYSAIDLYIAFGRNNIIDIMVKPTSQNKILQRSSITGHFSFTSSYKDNSISFRYMLKDLYGWESAGLTILIETSGLIDKYPNKKIMDPYKTNMEKGLLLEPKNFIIYGMADSECLIDIYHIKIKSGNSILKDVFDIQDESAYFNIHNIPITIGSFVSRIFEIYFQHVVFKNDPVLLLANNALSILNPLAYHYKENLKLFKRLNEFKSLDELYLFKQENPCEFEKLIPLLNKNAFKTTPISYCSIKYLVEHSVNSSMYLLALTTGGRTNNERPTEIQIEHGADVDISSAYGNQLIRFPLPLGIPSIYCKSNNDSERITLGEFLKKYEKNLTKHKMFKIVVSGELTKELSNGNIIEMEQDLIYSKNPSLQSAMKKISDFYTLESGQQVIPSQFILLRKEILNGSITFDVLEIIKKVCTNAELNIIYGLEVSSAIYYEDKNCTENLDEFLDNALKDQGSYEFTNSIQDTRTRLSFLLPINNFIGPLLKKRKELKSLKNDLTAQARQHTLKYIINSFWGIITSVFFPLNNVLVSELVTSSIRSKVWLMSKAFNTVLSITDGGPYSLMDVNLSLKSRHKPGISKLSNYNSYKDDFNRGPLANINWASLFQNNISPYEGEFQNLDQYAKDHIASFWSLYGIKIHFNLEHKIERCFIKGAFFQKAHYAFIIYDFESKSYTDRIYVIRSFRKDSRIQYDNPAYVILNYLLDNFPLQSKNNDLFEIPNNGNYEQLKLLKINSYLRSLDRPLKKSKNGNYNSNYGPNIFPGSSITVDFQYRLHNIYFPVDYLIDYKRRIKRIGRGKEVFSNNKITFVKNEAFDKYLPTRGILNTIKLMEEDNLKSKKDRSIGPIIDV
jgi:hypothetical protein